HLQLRLGLPGHERHALPRDRPREVRRAGPGAGLHREAGARSDRAGRGGPQAGRDRYRWPADDRRGRTERLLAGHGRRGPDRTRDGGGLVASAREEHRLRVGPRDAHGRGHVVDAVLIVRNRPGDGRRAPVLRRGEAGAGVVSGGSTSFDRAAAYYDETRGLTDEAVRDQMSLLASELHGRGRTLEIGVGTGQVALPLAAVGIRIVGLDLSEPMLRVLVEKGG